MTPAAVHYGRATDSTPQRARVLAAAYTRHPSGSSAGRPTPPELPTAAWINKPTKEVAH